MKAKYVQKGDAVDFMPTVDLDAGEIVRLGNLIGITRIPVKAGTLGTLALSGVFDVAKSAGITFSQGSNVFWNGQAAHDGALLGIAIQNATAESNHVRILLNSTANSQIQNSSGVDAQWQPL